MPNNWKTYKLGQICNRITDGSHSSPKENISGVRQIATVKDMNDFGFNLEQCKKISDKDFENLKNQDCVPEKGDVLFSKDGTIGKVLLFDFDYKIGILSSIAIFRPKKEIIDSRFLSYYLKEESNNNYIRDNYRSGSAIPRIILRDFKKYELSIPNLPEQQSIASILSAIDDKIENNLAINKTLEEMAMALYKHWFVDFGPFQDGEFVESELGMIPKVWKVLRLQDVSTLTAGGDKPNIFSNFLNDECNVPIYSNGITNDGLYGYTDKARINEESITVSARGTIGFVCLRQEPYLPIVRLIAVVPKKNLITSKYLFYWLKNQNINGNGTTQQQLTVPDFKDTKVLVPKFELIDNFTDIINPYYDKINSIIKENQTLTQLRDSLLPKLISGEVRLKEFRE